MKNKDKLLYVSAAVLAAGSVAGVKTTNVKAAEVKQADVNANSKLDLNKADKIAQTQIKQDTTSVQKTQDQLKQDQTAKTQAESAKTEAQNTLLAKENIVSNAQTKLNQAKQELTQTQAQNKDLHAQYDTTTENAVDMAQEAEKKLDQKVNDLSGQVQNAQNKQTDLLGQRTNVEGEIKTNTETLTNVNEQLNKARAEQTEAQNHFDAVQKDYVPIQNEYNAKKSAADKAAQDLKQNETDLAQSQKQLADLQTKNNDLAKTVNNTQGQLDNANKDLANTKTDMNQSQAKLNDVQKQNSDVNGKLTSAITKRDQAKSTLDSQSENQTKIVITPEFNKAFHKWMDIHDLNHVTLTSENKAEMVKELGDLSKQEAEMNHFESNAKDKEHKIDMMHLTYEDRLEANKFGINLVNQIRTQMGKKPVKLTVGSLKYANDVAKYYEADYPTSNFGIDSVNHDTKAIDKALVENGVKPGMGGEASSYGTYYDSDLDGRFGSFSIKNMDDLKHEIYNAVTGWMFNYEQEEWLHASIVTSMNMWDNTNYKNHNEEDPTYFGFAIMANAPHEENGAMAGDFSIGLETIVDNTIPGNPLSHPIDYNKFNVKDVISTDNSDSSQAGQVYASAQNEVNTLQGQKTDLDNQIKSLNDHITQSQTRVNDLTKTITDLSAKLANAKTEQGTVQGQIGQVSKHVDELKAAQPALIQANDNTVNALADYEQTHATVLNDYNNAKSQLEQANNKLQSATKANDEAEKVLNQNKAKLAHINQELDAVKAQLADLTTKLSDAKSSQTSAKANLEKAQADYDNYVNTHKDLIDSIAKSDKELADKEEAVRVAQADYDKASQEYKAAKKEADKLANKVKDLDQSIAKSQETIKLLNNRIASNTQIIENNKQVHAQAAKLAARKAFDAQINKALDNVVYGTKTISQHTAKAATVKPAVSTKNTKHALPQTGANDKLSLFAALAGLSLSSIGLGSLVLDKKRRRN
ncbi:SEC10/PgrA surface exclusion domain-containing protein [Lactobacillus taiwanensis]|uniref:SEC10/PgrA surface exclusion domain-containing protein n=1 Tax=Lactobacillus taiwanensis TaxID=508451 RepID=UPI000B992F3F|nr:SEC10/PgrA surface exclusion domain-containing protein [Lactobacillus taiwanensis]OYS28048.1 hypothetical protein CBF75_10260 [Lactobacillus taiwanensis]OYS32268.1 hypothetical protein CBF78_07765 [Lactobacillus taiwanensis]